MNLELEFTTGILDGIETLRIDAENRERENEKRGFVDADRAGLLKQVQELEASVIKILKKEMRKERLYDWIQSQKGIGEKQAARLLTVIGDPSWHPKEERQRTVSELWQYCGHGDPERSRLSKDVVKYGVDADGKQVRMIPYSPTAKKRVHRIAESAIKSGIRKLDGCDDENGYDVEHREGITEYGQVYLDARMSWADRTECSSAGCKKGCTSGHKHSHALRLVGKHVLKNMWIADSMLAQGAPDIVPKEWSKTTT